MIHYHGGPIWPDAAALRAWRGRHAFISYARPEQIGLAAAVCQSFAIDNGAFSFWKANKAVDWPGFYAFVDKWRRHPGFDFAVIPDVIEGSEAANDELLEEWPFDPFMSAPVWHINESIERLCRLAERYPRICIGSSGEYDVRTPSIFLPRAKELIRSICDENGQPICKLHGLRMLNPAIYSQLPLSTADSTNVAQNIGVDSKWKGTYQPRSKEMRASILVERIEDMNSAPRLDAFHSQVAARVSVLWSLAA